MRCEARRVLAKLATAAAGFNTDHSYGGVAQKLMEKADGVRTAADASEKMRRKAFFHGESLFAGLAADDRLKIADHRGIGMRAKNGTEQIVRVAHVGDPVAHSFVDGVLQSAAARFDADHLRAEHAHSRDVERLPRHVFRAHVNDALQTEVRGDGGGGHPVLPSAGFSDDARLAHFHCEQALANGVVDFVRAGVEQIFALKVDSRATEMRSKARSELQ